MLTTLELETENLVGERARVEQATVSDGVGVSSEQCCKKRLEVGRGNGLSLRNEELLERTPLDFRAARPLVAAYCLERTGNLVITEREHGPVIQVQLDELVL